MFKKECISPDILNDSSREAKRIIKKAAIGCDTKSLTSLIQGYAFYRYPEFLPSIWKNPNLSINLKWALIRRMCKESAEGNVPERAYWTFVTLARKLVRTETNLEYINEVVGSPGFEGDIINNPFASTPGKKTSYQLAITRFKANALSPSLFVDQILGSMLEQDLIDDTEATEMLSAVLEESKQIITEQFQGLQADRKALDLTQIACNHPKLAELLYRRFVLRESGDSMPDWRMLKNISWGANAALLSEIWSKIRSYSHNDYYAQANLFAYAEQVLSQSSCSKRLALDIYSFYLQSTKYRRTAHYSLHSDTQARRFRIYARLRGMSRSDLSTIRNNMEAAAKLI